MTSTAEVSVARRQPRRWYVGFAFASLFIVALFVSAWMLYTALTGSAQDDWQLVRTLEQHTGHVLTAEYSHDGRSIVSGALETIVWDANTAERRIVIKKAARRVAFSPDASRVVISTESRRDHQPEEAIAPANTVVSVHRVSDGAELFELPGFGARVCLPAFSPDGSRLATAAEDGNVDVWNAFDGRHVTRFKTPKAAYNRVYPVGPRSVVFSSDGLRLGIAYLKKLRAENMDEWNADPWEVTAREVQSGREITPMLAQSEREGLKPNRFDRDHWGATSRRSPLPSNAINELEQVEFKGYWCILAFTSPDGTQGLTTHENGVIRIWQRRRP